MRTQIFCTIAIGLLLGVLAVPVTAQTGSQIMLQKKFFRSLKYSHGDEAPQSVYTFGGLSFKPNFEEMLGQHPAALQEADKARLYNGIALAGGLTMVVGSAWFLANTIEDAQDLSDDRLPDNSFDATPLVVIVAGAVVSGVGLSRARKHLKRGVSIYNGNEGALGQAGRGSRAPGLQMSISPQMLGDRPGMCLSLRWP